MSHAYHTERIKSESPLSSKSTAHLATLTNTNSSPIPSVFRVTHIPVRDTTTAASDDGAMFLRRILTGGGGLAALRAASAVKETTGIVGLEVVPNAREVLIGLYTRTLKEIEAVPKDEGYRKAVESFTKHRLQICQEEDDWKRIEDKIGCGQVEELIEEAQDELKLINKMIGACFFAIPAPLHSSRASVHF
jgi:NADH dehydrogenase (ubiquinone) 1 alpha subcomplex subunit 5